MNFETLAFCPWNCFLHYSVISPDGGRPVEEVELILKVSFVRVGPHFKGRLFWNAMPKVRLQKVYSVRNDPFKFICSLTIFLG